MSKKLSLKFSLFIIIVISFFPLSTKAQTISALDDIFALSADRNKPSGSEMKFSTADYSMLDESAVETEKNTSFNSAGNKSLYRPLAPVFLSALTLNSTGYNNHKYLHKVNTQDVIEGRVMDADTGDPLPGVNILVKGTTTGTSTDGDGHFQLTVENLQVTLIATFIGYQRAEIPLNGRSAVDILLSSTSLGLDEVVVTGAGITALKKQLGQSISEVKADDILNSGASEISGALMGRIPGLVGGTQGDVGSTKPIRLRGTVSLSQRNEPIVYVDGVRMTNDTEGFAAITTSQLGRLDPNTIQSIEVLNGAAAATLYGTEASSGVIQITTKKGRTNQKPLWNVGITQGLSYTPLERLPENWGYDNSTGEIKTNFPADDYVNPGYINDYSISVSGGGSNYGYFSSFGFKDVKGSVPDTGLDDLNLMTNVNIQPIEGMDTQIKISVGNNEIQAAYPNWGLIGEFVLANPVDESSSRPYGELYHTVDGALAYDNRLTTKTTEFMGKMDYRISNNFRTHFLIGHNNYNRNSVIAVGPDLNPATPQGERSVGNSETSETTVEFNVAWDFQPTGTINNELIIGGQSYWQNKKSNSASVDNFISGAIKTLTGGSNITGIGETFQEVINAGVFLQNQLSINDRLFLSGGVRIDGNSTFGENLGFQPYPHAGLSWVVSDESFWNSDFISMLRLRSAYGVSGLQPGAFDKLRTWQVISPLGGVSVLVPFTYGNDDLKPERSQEIEIGANLELFSGRVGLDVTLYDQVTKDAILTRYRSPSEGFLEPQIVNLGKITGKGIEVAANGMLLDRREFKVELFGTLAKRVQKVDDLGGTPELRFGAARNFNFVKEGYQPGAVIAPVLDPSNPYTLSVPIASLTSVDQIIPNYLVDSDGNEVSKFLGNQLPTFTYSFGTTVNLPHNLTVSALFNGAADFVMQNETEQVRAQSKITPMVARMTRDLQNSNTTNEQRQAIVDEYSKHFPSVTQQWVENAAFLELQELSVRWSLPSAWLEKLSVSNASLSLTGNNLFLFTPYSGIMNPLTSGRATTKFAENVEYLGFPKERVYKMSLRFSF